MADQELLIALVVIGGFAISALICYLVDSLSYAEWFPIALNAILALIVLVPLVSWFVRKFRS